VHTPDRESVTVAKAGELWIERAKRVGRERGTWEGYGQHLEHHILPYLGTVRLNRLSAPMVAKFERT
jgi:integrase